MLNNAIGRFWNAGQEPLPRDTTTGGRVGRSDGLAGRLFLLNKQWPMELFAIWVVEPLPAERHPELIGLFGVRKQSPMRVSFR